MALSDKQEKVTLNSLSAVKRIEDEFTLRLDSTLRRLERQLTDTLAASQGVPAIDVALARANLERILVESGYYETTGALLNEGYQAVIDESYNQYQTMYGEAFRFSEVSLEELNALKTLDLQQFNQLGQTAMTEMNRLLADMQFGSIDFNQALKILREQVMDKLQRYTKTWLNTGLSAVYSKANMLLAEDAGIKKFQYIGTTIANTRPFCRKNLGKIKTKAEWDAEDNGQISPVSTFRGGYNCRHQLIGVVDEKAL
jgi:hypothetical protein